MLPAAPWPAAGSTPRWTEKTRISTSPSRKGGRDRAPETQSVVIRSRAPPGLDAARAPAVAPTEQRDGQRRGGELQAAGEIQAEFAGDAGAGDQRGAQIQGHQVTEPVEELLPRRAVQAQLGADRVRRRGGHLVIAVAARGDAEGDVAGQALHDGEARRRDEQDHRRRLDGALPDHPQDGRREGSGVWLMSVSIERSAPPTSPRSSR